MIQQVNGEQSLVVKDNSGAWPQLKHKLRMILRLPIDVMHDVIDDNQREDDELLEELRQESRQYTSGKTNQQAE